MRVIILLLVLLLFVASAPTAVVKGQDKRNVGEPMCRVVGELVQLPDLPEASGIAASRQTPGTLWAHNDSGQPDIVALDEQGSVKGRVRVTGARVDDWEDIAVGPCPQGSCVYIADIGDNKVGRGHITIYRAAEPSGAPATDRVEAFHATYPDGPHDAEALFVTPNGEAFIVTKGDPGPVALYRFPLRSGSVVKLERVGEPLSARARPLDRPTGADSSPDGRWIAVRTTAWVAFYAREDLTAGRWREAFRYDLSSGGEPQGEGVAFGTGGAIYLVGESGGRSRGGTFRRLTCALTNPGSARQ